MGDNQKPLDVINGLVEDYKNGFLTESDYLDLAFVAFQDAFDVFRKEYANEKYRWSEEDMTDFEDGYEAWLDGEVTEKYGFGCDFFKFMKAVDLPYEALEPLPIGIMPPKRTMTVTKKPDCYECIWNLSYRCVDDDGMFMDEDPVGNTYVLSDEMDCEAVLTVKSVKTTDNYAFLHPRDQTPRTDKDKIKYMTEFACTGYIEGYTAKRRRTSGREDEPYIYVYYHEDYSDCGGVYFITVYPANEDEDAIRSFPLWQDFFDWLDNKNALIRRTFRRYKNKMCGSC